MPLAHVPFLLGPLRETDVRDDVVVLVKSFLFDSK